MDPSIPRISVLMPVRDGARWIAEAIASVLTQTFRDFELIIVDDGSTDATPDILAGHAVGDARIVIMTQDAQGLVAALNAGLAAARAPLLARLDADDIAEPTRFAEQIDAMMRNPALALLGSWAFEIDGDGRRCGHRRPETDPVRLRSGLARGNAMIHSTVIVRTALARRVGGYRATFAAAEDYDLWLRLIEHGEVANLPRELVGYRVHAASITARKAMQQSLSTRLAQRSAALRRAGGADPAEPAVAIDLWSDPPPAYADDVQLYRLLAWSDPDALGPHAGSRPDFGALRRRRLTRRERGIAQAAISNYLAACPTQPPLALWAKMIALRPLSGITRVCHDIKRRIVGAGTRD